MVRRAGFLFGALVLCASPTACADVWGFQTIETGAGEGDGGSGGSSGGGGADGSSGSEGGGHLGPVDAGQQVTSEAGTCTSDISVSCGSNFTQGGFSCTGGATPQASLPQLSCSAGQAGSGGTTTFCCSGNWCGETGDPSDGEQCESCYLSNCAATLCACDTDPSVDSQGNPYCEDYAGCVTNCNLNSLEECESQCQSGYSSTALAEGNAIESCIGTYCAQACNALPP